MSSLHFLTKIETTHPLERFLEQWLRVDEFHVIWFSSHNLSAEGVKIDPNRVEAIKTLYLPRSKKEIQSFF
jgi:hypothetical protein